MSDEADETAGVLDHVLGPIKARLRAAEQERDAALESIKRANETPVAVQIAEWHKLIADSVNRLALSRKALEDACLHLSTMSSDNWPVVLTETLTRARRALDATPVASPPLGLDAASLETAAKVADEWARSDATEDSKMTGRSIAARIRSLTSRTQDPATKGTP